ncbi:MAG: metallophosphoesterase [Acidobacteria bacterium]|nr:metallophosphoesterase [Acidobacteriota bacterium]
MPHFGALGDIHGDVASVHRIMSRHPDVPFWLCVGDVANDEGEYEPVPAPLYWIKGNNEGFDAIAAGNLPPNLNVLFNGQARDIEGIRVAGLGGTFAPSWYETAAADLPHPQKGTRRATGIADKRRHFVREEVEACKALLGIDVFLTHEAPRPFRVGRVDAGNTSVNEVLAAMAPRLHLFGHHHRFSEESRQGVTSVGLDLVGNSYLLIHRATLEYERKS